MSYTNFLLSKITIFVVVTLKFNYSHFNTFQWANPPGIIVASEIMDQLLYCNICSEVGGRVGDICVRL